MYARILQAPQRQSFFLFGPRGTGKTNWVKTKFPSVLTIDLLGGEHFQLLNAKPERLAEMIPSKFSEWVFIDEIQRVPDLLNEVHRLIESRKLRFILTGSSARKLRRQGVNLLAGRALTRAMHPLCAVELGEDFDLTRIAQFGALPMAVTSEKPSDYLSSYVTTYLREEVQQEGLVRNIGVFGRFLESATFSQASLLNVAEVARECGVSAKVAGDYFALLEDLLLAVRLPVFTRKAKRKTVAHTKFMFFDVGVFRALRPRGPLDGAGEILGPALETLVWQEIRAVNDALQLGYAISFWRTTSGHEVDFVLYGPGGFWAIEVKAASSLRGKDLSGLVEFHEDYPSARCICLYAGQETYHQGAIEVLPLDVTLKNLPTLLSTQAVPAGTSK